MENKYLFGPVPSRRLGVSLGIDLVPYKTCDLDCIYCECGKTTCLTVERKEYVPVRDVLKELKNYLQEKPDLDYITFSGSGEPTLHSRINLVINFIKDYFPLYKVAVLTNSTFLTQSRVREQLKRADVVIPSLDAISEQIFRKINRPHDGLVCRDVISGIRQFRREYRGELWLEIMIVPGLNDTETELGLLKETIQEIKPDRVQLGTLDRPGTEPWVKAASRKDMERIATVLGGFNIIGKFASSRLVTGIGRNREKDIMMLLKRRPCTAEDIAHILQLRLLEVNKFLKLLLETKQIDYEEQGRGKFYKVKIPIF